LQGGRPFFKIACGKEKNHLLAPSGKCFARGKIYLAKVLQEKANFCNEVAVLLRWIGKLLAPKTIAATLTLTLTTAVVCHLG
jgi:hypothetical protein